MTSMEIDQETVVEQDVMIKGKHTTKKQFLSKHPWHQFLKEVRGRPESKGRTQIDIIATAKGEYKPPKCNHCNRPFE